MFLFAGLVGVLSGAPQARAQLGTQALAPELEPAPVPGQLVQAPDQTFSEQILEQGSGWQLKSVSGYAVDGDGSYYSEQVYNIQNQEGAYSAPLPYGLRTELAGAIDSGDTVFIVDRQIADEIAIAEAQGYLTPYLQSIAEPLDSTGEGPILLEPYGVESPTDEVSPLLFGSCSDRNIDRSKSFTLNSPINQSNNFGGGFSGTLSTSGNIQGSATGQVHLIIKRYKVFGVCVPYSVKFRQARAYGNAVVSYGAAVNGTVNYAYNWEGQVAKPFLGSLNFMAGPVPVHIGFNLPIRVGFDVQAAVTGTVQYNDRQDATGSFDYTCTLNGCSGYASYSLGTPGNPQPVVASVSGRIQPTVFVQVAVRAYLYDEWVAYAQVGVKPYLYGDLWGYYGNTCGDGDNDGINETVDALTFNLDWRLFITAEAAALGGTPKKWDNLWSTSRRHLRFWDLIGSSAIRPILSGPMTLGTNTSGSYGARMRPCWPYTDTMNYRFNWADGTTANVSGAPQTTVSANKAWSTSGSKAVQLTALTDSWGRNLNAATTRTVSVGGSGGGGTSGTWTAWLNRDAPSGNGDYETLADFRNEGYQVCASPIGIECQTTSGVDWSAAGEVYSCTAASGGACVNSSQPDGMCQDYRVRFLCPSSTTTNGAFTYTATNTNSAQQNTANHSVSVSAGQTLQLGTCTVSGSSGSGDTYLRLYDPSGAQVALNDDSCGYLSYVSFTASQSGTYQIRAGCYSSGSCSGTVAYTIQ